MSRNDSINKTKILVITAVVFILIASFVYGALTAPRIPEKERAIPVSTSLKTEQQNKKPQLSTELPEITRLLIVSYPKIESDYTIADATLYEDGKWFGATLRYKGTDIANRDTLRVLMENKSGKWIVRTKPPVPLLSTKTYPDVPKSVLQDINKVVGLP